jgi:serine/threonine-protein kinase
MELTPTRFARLQQLFEQALERPAAEQASFLERACAGDSALRSEVEALLRAHASDSTMLNQPVSFAGASQPPDDESRWLGQRIGPWRVTRRIGFGGMGTVYEAVRADDQFEKRVAVKFLHRHTGHPNSIRRFIVERQILANLDHPNIATLLDGGVTDDGQPYLVMEYIDGEPITQWCDHHTLERRARIELFLQVCAAVEAAHRNLIVHRDLKPGNILVTQDGRAKLLDFGIARLLDERAAEYMPTRSSEPISFTPEYAAPEQMRNQVVSTSTDVFALGAVLYQILTGRLPFRARTDPGAVAAPAAIDADLDAILERALQPEADKRYASVLELRSELQRYLQGEPVAARQGGRTYRVKKFIGRHRVGSIAAAGAVLAIVTAGGIALWQAGVARQAAADTRQLNEFLMDVLRMSDPFNEGEDLTLSAALDEAAKSIDERFAGRPDLSAEIRFGIGYSMVSRYRLEQADVQLQRAMRDSIEQFGESDIRTLRVLEGIAGLRLEQSRFDEAEADYLRCIAALEKTGQQRDPLYFKAVGNLGNLYLIVERFAESEKYLRLALAVERDVANPDPLDHANLLNNLGQSAHGLQELERADKLYGEAQQAYEALFPNGSPDLAILLNNRAILNEEFEDIPKALALHKRSLEIRRKVFRDRHPMVVVALASVARNSLAVGDKQTALKLAIEGAETADRVYTEPNRYHPSIYATLAAAQLANDDVTAAVASLNRSKQLLTTLPVKPPSVVRWVEKVSADLCAQHPDAKPHCAQ